MSEKYTAKQGEYLAYIYHYTKLNRQPPAETDLQRYFGTTPPTAHSTIVRLHEFGLIDRVPRKPRSIRVLVSPAELPDLP